ncbi:MAG: hypothetical protein U9Q07_01175, partial [Planctomycetota bacterium]|nr:hypothetical protein [Planctomycetota bacterium]
MVSPNNSESGDAVPELLDEALFKAIWRDARRKMFLSRNLTQETPVKRRIHQWMYAAAIATAVSVGGIKSAGAEVDTATNVADEASYRTTVVADWAAQERRRGRTPDSPEAIRDALAGANRLLRHLSDSPGVGDLHAHAKSLRRLQEEIDRIQSLDEADRLELYHRARSVGRALVFENPLVGSKPVVFM